MAAAAHCVLMEANSCDCTRDPSTDTATDGGHAHFLSDGGVMHADLPDDLQAALGTVVGDPSVETLAEWVAEVRDRLGGSLDVGDLCHADAETPHRGHVDGETYHFQCFYDAVALSGLVDERVEVRTESPDGAVVEATAEGVETLSVTPEDAVFSFGVADDPVAPTNDVVDVTDVYEAICPYVKAFPDGAAYREWADTVPAATVAAPLGGATELAAALVAED